MRSFITIFRARLGDARGIPPAPPSSDAEVFALAALSEWRSATAAGTPPSVVWPDWSSTANIFAADEGALWQSSPKRLDAWEIARDESAKSSRESDMAPICTPLAAPVIIRSHGTLPGASISLPELPAMPALARSRTVSEVTCRFSAARRAASSRDARGDTSAAPSLAARATRIRVALIRFLKTFIACARSIEAVEICCCPSLIASTRRRASGPPSASASATRNLRHVYHPRVSSVLSRRSKTVRALTRSTSRRHA